MLSQWHGFKSAKWIKEINLRDFIQTNYSPYTGDESFLTNTGDGDSHSLRESRTQTLWHQVQDLMVIEREKGIFDTDTEVVSTITSHHPGYINRELEQIVGLQTERPLKRAIMPFGGIRVVKSLQAYGYEINPKTADIFTQYRKTHNDGVFDGQRLQLLPQTLETFIYLATIRIMVRRLA